jgi:hypothetical protein
MLQGSGGIDALTGSSYAPGAMASTTAPFTTSETATVVPFETLSVIGSATRDGSGEWIDAVVDGAMDPVVDGPMDPVVDGSTGPIDGDHWPVFAHAARMTAAHAAANQDLSSPGRRSMTVGRST